MCDGHFPLPQPADDVTLFGRPLPLPRVSSTQLESLNACGHGQLEHMELNLEAGESVNVGSSNLVSSGVCAPLAQKLRVIWGRRGIPNLALDCESVTNLNIGSCVALEDDDLAYIAKFSP